MRDKQVIVPRRMDQDIDDRLMPDGSYREAVNLRIASPTGSDSQVARPIQQLTNLNWTQSFEPFVNPVHLGSFEDKDTGDLYWFTQVEDPLDSSTKVDYIHRLKANSPPFEFEVVVRGLLGFSQSRPFKSFSKVGDELGFTDGVTGGYKINVKTGVRNGKNPIWRIYFSKKDDGLDLFTLGQDVSIELSLPNISPNPIPPTVVLTSDGTFQNDVRTAALKIADFINDDILTSAYLVAKATNSYVEVEDISQTGGLVDYSMPALFVTASGSLDVKVVPVNYYPDTISDFHFKRTKRPHLLPPTTQYVVDESRSTNTLYGNTPQFQIQYVYRDGEKSTWSPISDLPDGSEFGGGELAVLNAIDVDFTDPLLSDGAFLSSILKVNIGVRFGNNSNLYLAKTMDPSEIGIHRQWFRFFNDETYTVVDPNEAGRQFDAIPQVWQCEEGFSSKNGEGERVVLSNYVEGYDNVGVSAKINRATDPNNQCPGTYDIEFRVDIMNQGHTGIYRFQPIREFNGEPHFGGVDNGSAENLTPFSQYKIPLKGFVGFLAGTNYKAITKQNKPAGVTYSDEDFGVVGAGQTAQINADQSNFFSTGVIKGVKPGKYILRLASNLCTQGDGSAYDINGIEYQNTSTFVYSANGGVGTREILLDLPDIPNGTKTTLNAGTFVVEDKINGSDLNYHGYVVDTDGSFDREDLELAYTMEGQVVNTQTLGGANSETVTADHNGFFYGSLPSGDGVLRFQVPKTPTATGSNIYDFSDGVTISNYFIGNYDDLRNATEVITGSPNPAAYDYRLVAMTDLPYNLFANYQLGVFLVNKNEDYDAYHFDIAELIQYGNPVKALPGMTFALEGTGRTAKSGKDGQAIIRTYSPNTGTQRSGLNVMIGNDTLYCVVDNNPYPETVTIQYGPLSANSINQYIVTLISTPQKYWKHGDTIRFGIVYYDEWGRSGAVNTNESLNIKIPFFGENDDANLGQVLSWEIHHQPPVWAHYYQWVRTKGILSNYIQMAVDGAKYVKSYNPSTDDYSYVAYGGGATEVHLDLQTITNTAKVSPSWRVGYSFVEGDRVRIVRLGDGDYPDDYYHAKVLGQIGDSLSIEYDPSWPEVTEGMVVELYSPAPSTDIDTSIFYEFSDRYEISSPGDSGRNHSAPSLDQTYFTGIPALGSFETGNTFIKQRKFLINEGQNQVFVEVEDTAFSDFYPSTVQSIGRPNTVDETFRQITKPNSSRFSNKFYSDSASGTSSFEPLNEKNFPNSVGGINEMVFNENVLVCIGKMKTFSIYVGESQITSGSDQVIVSLSNEVLGAWRMMKGDYGTVNPRSVAMNDGDLYWYDMTRGAVVRYAADGLTPISDNGMRSTWTQFQNLIFTETLEGAIDPIHNEYLLYCSGLQAGKRVAVFSIDSGNWTSYYSHELQSINVFRNQYVISFLDQFVQIHNQGGSYLPSEIKLVSNKNLLSEKTYQNIAIDSHFNSPILGTWESPLITVKTSDNQDQASFLQADDFRLTRGQYTASFWRDFNSQGGIANGDRLRGTSMAITISTPNSENWEMFAVEVSFSDSQRDI